jgi:DNA-directed RNA polymerase sigma subunit (sigma70/sigma32)
MTNNRKAIEQQIDRLLLLLASPSSENRYFLPQSAKQLMDLREQLNSEGESYSLKELGEIFGLTMEQVRGVIMMGQVWRTQVTEPAKAAG